MEEAGTRIGEGASAMRSTPNTAGGAINYRRYRVKLPDIEQRILEQEWMGPWDVEQYFRIKGILFERGDSKGASVIDAVVPAHLVPATTEQSSTLAALDDHHAVWASESAGRANNDPAISSSDISGAQDWNITDFAGAFERLVEPINEHPSLDAAETIRDPYVLDGNSLSSPITDDWWWNQPAFNIGEFLGAEEHIDQPQASTSWRKVQVDVDVLIDHLIETGFCLGISPGYSKDEADIAFQKAIIQS